MGSFAPMLCLLTACPLAGARAFLHGSLVLGCPSDRAHDSRVVELGIEEPSLPPAFPGHPLPAANTASFSGTFLAPGTDVTSDTHDAVGAYCFLPLDTTERALNPSASVLAPLLAVEDTLRTSHPAGDETRPQWRSAGGAGALEKVDPFFTHNVHLDMTESACILSASVLAPLPADATCAHTSHPAGDGARPQWHSVGGVGALEKVDPFSTLNVRLRHDGVRTHPLRF